MSLPWRSSYRSARSTASALGVVLLGLGVVGLLLPPLAAAPAVGLRSSGTAANDVPLAAHPGQSRTDATRAPTWQNLTAVLDSGPGSRSGAAAAFDVAANEAVVFGGFGVANQPLSGTWLYSNGTWSHPKTNGTPPARAGAAMTYDPLTGQVIMFGGHGLSGPLSDTWTFANDNWTNVTASAGTAPAKRYFAAFGWDSVDGEAVLFGGRNYLTVLDDTWVFLGGTWVNISATAGNPNGTPSTRFSASFAFDPTDQCLVLFGGNGSLAGAGRVLGDTWWFRGGHWSEPSPTFSPSPRFGAALVDDASVGALVLFGGQSAGGSLYNDTWTYANGTWSGPLSNAGTAPSPRLDVAAVAYLGSVDQDSFLLLLGGGTPTGGILNDTWIFGSETILSVEVGPNRTGVDVGQSVEFVARPIGGAPPYAFAWTGLSAPLPTGCGTTSSPSIACPVSTPGRFGVAVNVSESAGGTATEGTAFVTVSAKLSVSLLTVLPYPYHVGEGKLTITATVTGGAQPLSFAYAGLPSGCVSTNKTNLTCAPTSTGDFVVTLNVTDAAGASSTSNTTLVVDGPAGSHGWTAGDSVAVAVVVVLAVIVALLLLRRRKHDAVPAASPSPPPGVGR
jgi:hypothetical protein